MPRDYRVSLEDILNAGHHIASYVAGMTFPEFEADGKTQDAVIRNLE
jgi:uncharacterized protein with HEPN domain